MNLFPGDHLIGLLRNSNDSMEFENKIRGKEWKFASLETKTNLSMDIPIFCKLEKQGFFSSTSRTLLLLMWIQHLWFKYNILLLLKIIHMRDRYQKIDNESPIETFFQCNSNN
jgi:hypothetical protein